jgi:hypothetical protein
MAFPLEILQSGIAVADALTKGVQAQVTLEQWTGQDEYGNETYATAITIEAVVDYKHKQKTLATGRVVNVVATLTVVGDIAPNSATGRRNPVDPRDKITLPDGTTGPILDAPNAVLDPSTGRGLIHEIMLGEVGSGTS